MNNIFQTVKNYIIKVSKIRIIRILFFVDLSIFIGFYLGLKLFFPQDFVLLKINNQLFPYNYGVTSDEVNFEFPFGLEFENMELTKKGKTFLLLNEFEISPDISMAFGNPPSGELSLNGLYNEENFVDISFDLGKNGCFEGNLENIPLGRIISKMFDGIFLKGETSGEFSVCKAGKKQKFNGNINLKANNLVFKGKIPSPMGAVDLGRIVLGNMNLTATVLQNKVSIKNLKLEGLFNIELFGEIFLNTRSISNSRLDLEVKLSLKNDKILRKNAMLNIAFSQLKRFKKGKFYKFHLGGFLNNPRMRKSTSKRRKKFNNKNNRKRGRK